MNMFIVFTESYEEGIKLRVHVSSQDLRWLWTESEWIYEALWPRQRECDSGLKNQQQTSNLCIYWTVWIHYQGSAIKDVAALHFQIVIIHPERQKHTLQSTAIPTSFPCQIQDYPIFRIYYKKRNLPAGIRSLLLSLNTEMNVCPIYSCMYLDPLQSLIWKCLKHNTVKPCDI